MGDCKIVSTTNKRLEEYINQYGQAEGLRRFIKQTVNPDAMTFESIPADKEVYGVKFLYRYDKASSDATVSRISDDIGKKYVNVFETKDLRGNPIFKIVVTNPNNFQTEDELVGISSDNPFETLSAYLQGQRRIKYTRKSLIESTISEYKAKGKDTKSNEAKLVKLLSEIAELESDIEQYNAIKDAEALKIIASKQIAWVTSTLGKENITSSELTEIDYIINLWSDIRTVLYGESEELPEDVKNVFTDIGNMINSEDVYGNFQRVNSAFLANQAGYDSSEQLWKEFHNVKDSSILKGWGLDLSATGIKLITRTDLLMRNNLARGEQEIKERLSELFDKFKKLSDAGKDYKILFQKNLDGNFTGNLTNRYSQSWYDSVKIARNKLKNTISAINTSGVPDGTAKKLRRKAYLEYSNWMKGNAETIDIRFFIEEDFTDSIYTKETYTNYLEGLFGKERTTEIIRQAEEQYERYLNDLESVKEDLRSQKDIGEITMEEYTAKLDEWVLRNSPIIWFKQNEPMSSEFPQTYNNYTVTKPKKFIKGKPSGWYDANYEQIENDADLLELYNYVREFMTEMMSYIPNHLKKDQDVHAGFLPRVRKALLAELNIKDLIGMGATLKEDWIQSITSREGLDNRHLEINPVTGRPYKNIPSAFITNIPVDDRSFELDKILGAFGKMAIEYKWKSRVEDSVLLVHKFLDNVSTSEKRKQNTSDDLSALKAQLEYATDVLIYNEAKLEEGKSNLKFFKGNSYIADDDVISQVDARVKDLRSLDKPEDEILNTIKGEFGDKVKIVSQRKRYKYLRDSVDAIEEKFYNQEITEEERDKLVAPLEEEAMAMGRSVVWSKVGDKILRYNQALALGFNPFSAVNNYLFGVNANIMWAAGNTDFTPRQMWQAFGIMWRSVLNLKDKRMDKAANLIALYDILSEVVEYKSNGVNGTLEKIRNSPFAMLKKGDYMIKGQTFIATMLNTKIKDINGVERSLYEAYDNEGKWKTDEFGDDKNWNGDFTDENEMQDFLKFRNKSTQLIKKIHGNFDPKSPVRYKKYILGRMIGQFRFSWMMEGVEQRFGKRRYDEMLDRAVEGRYITYYNLGFKKSLKTLAKLALGQATAFKGVRAQDRAIVEENMRRNLMEIYLYAVLTAIYLTIKSLADDDDDEELYLTMNMLQRVMADTTFYLTPSTFGQIIQEPFPIYKVYTRASKAFNSAEQLIFNDDLTQHQEEQKWANITNAFPYINQYNRFKYMSEKVRTY